MADPVNASIITPFQTLEDPRIKDYRTKPDRTKMTQAAISIQAQ
jgi:hypothetical protein